MNITFEPLIDQGPVNDASAIAMCLFKSERLNPKKHLAPLDKFWTQKHQDDYKPDVLIFVEKGFDYPFAKIPGVRVFEASGATGWFRHFYRYAACHPMFNNYGWIRFTGTDTPRQLWLEKLLPIASQLGIPLACALWGGGLADSLISGSCLIRRDVRGKLHDAMSQPFEDAQNDQWNCDEIFLTDWFLKEKIPILWLLKAPLINSRMQQLILDRLYTGPRTVILGAPGERQSGFKDGHLNL